MNEKIFPSLIITEMVLASIPYFLKGEWKIGVYWLAAAILNAAITF